MYQVNSNWTERLHPTLHLAANRLYLSMETKRNYRLKPVEEKDRASLPSEIKLLMMFAMKNFPIPQELLDDSYERFPECFEAIVHNQLTIE